MGTSGDTSMHGLRLEPHEIQHIAGLIVPDTRPMPNFQDQVNGHVGHGLYNPMEKSKGKLRGNID